MDIQIDIERLILEGLELAPHQGPLVKAAVEAELGRLLVEQGLGANWEADQATPRLATEPMQVAPGATPAELGQQIAQSIYQGFSP